VKIALKEHDAKIVSVNPRAELHGENPKPACDVKIEIALPNTELAQLNDGLRAMLYAANGSQGDLVDGENHMTALRFPQLGTPLKWDGEMIGAEAVFHYGTSEKSHIRLPGCIVGEVRLEPLEGGSVVTTMRLQCHPDEKAFGRLCLLVGSKLPVSLTPPEADPDVLVQRTKEGDVYA
jgi:hypothetical protein